MFNVGEGFSAISSFIKELVPLKSPHFLVVFIGIFGLISLNFWFSEKLEFFQFVAGFLINQELEEFAVYLTYLFPISTSSYFYWIFLSIPIALVLVVLAVFTIRHNSDSVGTEDKGLEDIRGQIKISQALCISSAVLCLVFGGIALVKDDSGLLFILHYLACLCQITLFLFFSMAPLEKEKLGALLNHYQIALVTASYLVGATICMSLINPGQTYSWLLLENYAENFIEIFTDDLSYIDDTGEVEERALDRFAVTAIFFYAIWASYQCFWFKWLRQTESE